MLKKIGDWCGKRSDFGCQCSIDGKCLHDGGSISRQMLHGIQFTIELCLFLSLSLVPVYFRHSAFILIDVIGKIEKAMAKTLKSNNFAFGSLNEKPLQ